MSSFVFVSRGPRVFIGFWHYTLLNCKYGMTKQPQQRFERRQYRKARAMGLEIIGMACYLLIRCVLSARHACIQEAYQRIAQCLLAISNVVNATPTRIGRDWRVRLGWQRCCELVLIFEGLLPADFTRPLYVSTPQIVLLEIRQIKSVSLAINLRRPILYHPQY